jgi:hypothetical protein
MYPDLEMDNQLLRKLFSKKRLVPDTKRQTAVNHKNMNGTPQNMKLRFNFFNPEGSCRKDISKDPTV